MRIGLDMIDRFEIDGISSPINSKIWRVTVDGKFVKDVDVVIVVVDTLCDICDDMIYIYKIISMI